MKHLTNIFENIFDQDSRVIEDYGIISDPKSAFSREWVPQIPSDNTREFKIKNNLLCIGAEDLSFNQIINIHYAHPLTDYLHSIKGIYTVGNLAINMRGHDVTPAEFGSIIQSERYINIANTKLISGIQFKGCTTGKVDSVLSLYQCNDCNNCTFDDIVSIENLDISTINAFTKCKSDSLKRINMEGDNIFKNGWPEFEKLIDWDKLDLPVNLQTQKPVSVRLMKLSKMINIIKYYNKYNWGAYHEIPLTIQGPNIFKKLFPDCQFPKLEEINIRNNFVVLCINIKKGECYLQASSIGQRHRR